MTGITKSGGTGQNRPSGARTTKSSRTKQLETDVSRKETADYIASMLESMQLLALKQQLPFLSYLIGMALEEANGQKAKRD